MQKTHDECNKKILEFLPCAVIEQSECQLADAKRNNDVPFSVQQQCQWVIKNVEEKLTQCNNLIQQCNSFNEKYQEGLTFIMHGEEVIGKNFSGSTDVATQLEKCSVSD